MKQKSSPLSTLFTVVFLLPSLLLSNIFAQDFDCSDCHEPMAENSVHAMLGCADCHSDVEDEEHIDSGAASVNCGECHDDFSASMKKNIHARLNVSNAPTCKSCHGTHQVKSPSIYKDKGKVFCASCHGSNISFTRKFHQGSSQNSSCFECHDEEEISPKLTQSVHSSLNCADCHNYAANNIDDHFENTPVAKLADCGFCHSEINEIYQESIHGIALVEGADEAAKCWDCHGAHNIKHVADADSPVKPENLANMCGTCHDNPEIVEKYQMTKRHPGESYTHSIHGKIVSEGGVAASCTSCHGVHDIKNKVQDNSTISAQNIPETCGQCHPHEAEDFTKSIHWIRAKKGVRDSPVCNDCHNEHSIQTINGDDNSRLEARKLQEETCFQCHQNPKIIQRYSDGGAQTSLYRDSYHGLAAQRGYENAAMCVDCHGVHKILPQRYAESTVSIENITTTCQKCHAKASEVFSRSYSHRTQSEEAEKIENIVSEVYFWLIIAVIGGMLAHNFIILFYETSESRRKAKNVIRMPRFTKNEIVQHILLLTSFILLAITGFALKYPNSFWSVGLLDLGMTEPIRQNIHRTSAVVMIALSVYHLIYLLFTARGRDVLIGFIPTPKDIKAAIENIKFHLRISKTPPKFEQYDYAEKAEYWALIWGTLVMGVTGLILWFPTMVGEWAPIWLIKVSETIHFMEAVLATLAIVVWHWFFVIYRPSIYPMSFVWLDGKMPLHDYRHHHEQHFRRIILEWFEYKSEKHSREKLGNYTSLFIKTLDKYNIDPEEVFNNELNKDPELKIWLDEELAKSSN